MYDTVNFIYEGDNLLESVPCYLSNISETTFESGEMSISGNLGSDLRIRVNQNNLIIKNRSLSKWYLKDAFRTLSRGDTQRAVEKISDSLHLSFEEAKVTRIDVAQNLLVNHPEFVYYQHLGDAKYYFNRLEENNGLYYGLRSDNRRMLFYGKIREQKAKQNPVPQYLKDKHIIRYELRFQKRVAKQFQMKKVKARNLYDEDFYCNILDRWAKEYFQINKINTITKDIIPTGSTKDFKENLAIIGLNEIGFNKTFTAIKEWQAMGKTSRKQASDLRRQLKVLSQKPLVTEKSELIEELDKKVKDAILHFK